MDGIFSSIVQMYLKSIVSKVYLRKMGLKSILVRAIAPLLASNVYKAHRHAGDRQRKLLKSLVRQSYHVHYLKDLKISRDDDAQTISRKLPIVDYEDIRHYIDRVREGEKDVLWRGLPKYWAKTSGTTSGAKYIPLTKESMPDHIRAARNALFCLIADGLSADFFDGDMIFLQGSPELVYENDIAVGRLSGIVYHHVPSWLQRNRQPSYEVNCIEDWEAKVEQIASDTSQRDMRLISGIPPWCVNYFERLLSLSKKQNLLELFPNLSVFAYGGVQYAPYKASIDLLIGSEIQGMETYPASEGFIAFQDKTNHEGLLLNLEASIVFQFVPLEDWGKPSSKKLFIDEVELGVNYAVVLTSNAGLWSYSLGDTVRFVSKSPYRLEVTGRVKHYISAFGEHVIGEEVERAMQAAKEDLSLSVREFTVAPEVNPSEGKPYHEWFIEFEEEVSSAELENLSKYLDEHLRKQNTYYDDLREGEMLSCAKITKVPSQGFEKAMRASGQWGGQSKVKRLANDRDWVNFLLKTMK